MHYVLIENGTVIEGPRMLPENWRNISGLNLLNNEQILSYGWYPYVFVPYKDDMSTKVVIQPLIEITENEYIEWQQVRDKTPEEIAADTESKWQSVRAQRNIYLQQSDWTQLGDVTFTPDVDIAWKQYRKKLREITNFTSPDSVIWPDMPLTSSVVELTVSLGPTGESGTTTATPQGPSA